eukprot:1892482-Pyramimonas_sp.AAC.1
MGSAGQTAVSDFDSGADAAFDYSDMPAYLTKEKQAQWSFSGRQKHKRRWRRFMKKPVRKVR